MKRCEMNDLPGLLDFYRLVIRDTAEIAVHARWERYCERLEQEIAALEKKSAAPPKQTVRAGPDAATRKKLRSQRKKKK